MILLQFAILLLLCGGVHFLEPKYEKQTIGVPEKFTVESFGHEGNVPVQVSLRSNLDKAVTRDSQQPQLSSTNQHQRFSSLKKNLEESPSRDEVDKSKNVIKEENMVQADKSRLMERKPDLKTPKRSKRTLKEEIEEVERYSTEKLKQCCWDGYEHYRKASDCYTRLKEKQKEWRPRCYKAFEQCCIHSQNNFVKPGAIVSDPGTYSYCVQMPKFWKVGESQKVTVVKKPWHCSSYSCLIRMLLLSYPDKNVTYDSQEFLLNNRSQDTSVSLMVKLDDLPNGDELEKFVYLVIDFDGLITERKVPLLDLHVTQLDLKKSNGSPEDLESKIEALASTYPLWRVKMTCRKGYKHYVNELECQSRLTEMEEEGTPRLYRVFRKCCLYAREYTHKLANTEPEQYNIHRMRG